MAETNYNRFRFDNAKHPEYERKECEVGMTKMYAYINHVTDLSAQDFHFSASVSTNKKFIIQNDIRFAFVFSSFLFANQMINYRNKCICLMSKKFDFYKILLIN